MAFTIYSHGISVWFYIILDRYIWESIKICMHWLLDIYNLMEVLSHLNDGRLDTNLLDYSPYFVFFAAIGGPTGEILETNLQVLSQISTNLSNMQVFFFSVWFLSNDSSLLFRTRPLFFVLFYLLLVHLFFADTG